MASMARSITLHGDTSGWLGETLVSTLSKAQRNSILEVARGMAKEAAERLGEPVEARVMRAGGTRVFGVRHVPGVTTA
jgi:hypothetical protein